MVVGQGQDPITLTQQALVLMVIASTVSPLGLLHHHGRPAAFLVIVRVGQHQALQLLRQRTAQQDSHGHATGLVAVQRGAEVRQQRRQCLLVPQMVGHEELESLRVALCGHLQGSQKLLSPQRAGATRRGFM
ncbi:hypothetical protein D3C87_1591990 [compost metagenome]